MAQPPVSPPVDAEQSDAPKRANAEGHLTTTTTTAGARDAR